jgi:hypothetical protein
MKAMAGVGLVLCVVACASAPAQPSAVNPVGTFDFSTTVEGTAVTGTIVVTESSSGYGGTVSTNVTESAPINSVLVDGQSMTVSMQTPDGPATITLNFTGESFTGTWSYAGMSGPLTGQRRAG